MQEIILTVYNIHELLPPAQENAIDDFRRQFEGHNHSDYEIRQSISVGCAKLGGRAIIKHINWINPETSQFKCEITDELYHDQFSTTLKALASYNIRTMRGLGDCKLTGVCWDEDFLDGVRREFIRTEPKKDEWGIERQQACLIQGIRSALRAGHEDYLAQMKKDWIIEFMYINDFLFTYDGKQVSRETVAYWKSLMDRAAPGRRSYFDNGDKR